jgi:hypothetical protein
MKKIESGIDARRVTRMSVAFIAAVAMLGLINACSTGRPVGSVTQVSGSPQIERGGATLAAQPGTPVKLHDKVTTPPGASATLEFSDGSSITVGASSSVAIDDSGTVNGQTMASRVQLINGDIHPIVPDRAGQPPVVVKTGNAKATGSSPNQ